MALIATVRGAPSFAFAAASEAPPQPSPHSGDHHNLDDWLHRHLGPGIPSP
ncbi:hypothetical protein [Mycobacterium sp. 1245801.1]|uniref:hypothetical protein n=1 Tax=Mycobacterium sp. 1245801.1 TaxID=1834075 RepID=UPI000A468335|nr:hypothetical protein [Mycobacterium sp. 1245801.1]